MRNIYIYIYIFNANLDFIKMDLWVNVFFNTSIKLKEYKHIQTLGTLLDIHVCIQRSCVAHREHRSRSHTVIVSTFAVGGVAGEEGPVQVEGEGLLSVLYINFQQQQVNLNCMDINLPLCMTSLKLGWMYQVRLRNIICIRFKLEMFTI